uniref:Uncharacterized protein n=1 Tax=Octactis speculum TaxID=3111310 RepID=A0A7S2DTE8_9STRA|mmetsp:Transcript_54022/g.73812  ORF Transcript_54022/g.73812 Transcript_54022/m.73812 type:complete len:102 (+) Transcript_54022:53-358(+)
MYGNLRGDLCEYLLNCEQEADLVLVVGSSPCGTKADRLVSTFARSEKRQETTREQPPPDWCCCMDDELSNIDGLTDFGSVVVSVQKTVHDNTRPYDGAPYQ